LLPLAEVVLIGEQGGTARLKRRIVERVLDACMHERGEQAASLLPLLRRFAVEAAREEARLLCDDLVAEGGSHIRGELFLQQGCHDPLPRQRQIANTGAEGVRDGVSDRCRGRSGRDLADAEWHLVLRVE
jgi:hypothetical protein